MTAIVAGKVVNGKVEVEDFELPEGADVTVLLREEDDEFELTPEQEAEMEESIAELDRGEGIPAEEVLRQLRDITAKYKQQHGK